MATKQKIFFNLKFSETFRDIPNILQSFHLQQLRVGEIASAGEGMLRQRPIGIKCGSEKAWYKKV